ncbi:MAG TPA: biopolymer transporter ExbD [Terriglobales bacterium]|nr:biopolymer transporter ExbD [Terriglobales bacterium]
MRHRTEKLIFRMDVSAFAAILVVLLGLFAIPGGIAVGIIDYHRVMPVDLIKVKRPTFLPNAARDDAMFVSVTRDGSIFFNNERTVPELLPQKIHEFLAKGAEHRVYINADKRSYYKNVKQVIDAAHSSGIENISFLADPFPPSK